MIALLRGLVAERGEDHLVVDVQGVGYKVFVPGPTARSLGGGEEVHLQIHTHVREDAIQLFGFVEPIQRQIFLSLNTVKGIGPKLAMSVLGNSSVPELVDAVSTGDVKRLTHIPGLGKKTAERILVELQGPFAGLVTPAVTGELKPKATGDAMLNDVASALANLGFKAAQIDRALDSLRDQPERSDDFDVLFREAMRHVR